MIHPRAVIRDQLQPVARLRDQPRIDPVRERRHDHISLAHGARQFLTAHRRVILAQGDIEQVAHPRLDRLGQASRHDNTQAGRWHEAPPQAFISRTLLPEWRRKERGTRTRLQIDGQKSNGCDEITWLGGACAGPLALLCRRRGPRAGDQPAASPLRVHEGLRGQCAARPQPHPPDRLGVQAPRHAADDHRRIRPLAARAGSRRRGRMGALHASVGGAHRHHRGRDARSCWPAPNPARWSSPGWNRGSSPASPNAARTGARSQPMATTAGPPNRRSGASSRTKRWIESDPPATRQAIFFAFRS